MKTTYDRDTVVPITKKFKEQLIKLMIAHCDMMRQAEPEYADCWEWGICTIGDLAYQHLEFQYGGFEDTPNTIQKKMKDSYIPFVVQVDEEIQNKL